MADKDLNNQLDEMFSGLEDPNIELSETDKEPLADLFYGLRAHPKHVDARCPYLGLAVDLESHSSDSQTLHRCFAAGQETAVPLEHQAAFCLTENYRICARFVEPPVTQIPTAASSSLAPKSKFQKPAAFSWLQVMLWLLAGLLAVFAATYYGIIFLQQSPATDSLGQEIARPHTTPTLSPAQTVRPPVEAVDGDGSDVLIAFSVSPTATPTLEPDKRTYTISPGAANVGWVSSGEERGNHFGDSYLYAGVFDGQIYHGAFQFDLSSIPRGAPIYQAAIQLTGLRDDLLAVRRDQSGATGAWALRLLVPEIDQDWRRHSYQDIFNASTLQTLSPILGDEELAEGKANVFKLSADQIRILETRIIEDEKPTISFRIDGPLVGPDNLFAWDTGYGSESQGNQIILSLDIGPPPATPPAYNYVIVTSTPTPETMATAAAIVLQMTADATRIGTATPVPPNVVTATPIPDYLIITPTPTPENVATAQARVALATYEALTTGTPAPLPTNAVTATPTPSQTPTPTFTPIIYVIITDTPTPESIFAAATLSAEATARAQNFGTPTPLPADWVTPIVVTATPIPANEATAQALVEMATALAFTTGTPTPTPSNMVTATPTPVFEPIAFILTPTPVPATSTPQTIPSSLLGKILFRSDREEGELDHIYVLDPETTELGRLTDSWPYEAVTAREAWSRDQRFRVFTKDTVRYKNIDNLAGETIGSKREDIPALYLYDYFYKAEQQLTNFGAGIAYGGVWSPTNEQIAFVSNDSGDDEIWVINGDGSNLRQLTSSNEAYNAREIGKDTFIPELSKYPSWSPDGKQIVFTSNRTGNQQLWIMNADGSDQRLLMGWDNWTPYNDWAPVWVKYLDPAPPVDKIQ